MPVEELLHSAAMGRAGVDRRLLRQILEDPDAVSGLVRFAQSPRQGERLDLEPLLVDLFRHFQPPEALDFYLEAIRRSPEEVSDQLVEAILPLGGKAVDPLLALYQELGEERGGEIAFLLAGLGVRDPRILELLLERLEYDAADGAFTLGIYGDPAARPALEKMLAEIPEQDVQLRRELKHALDSLSETPARDPGQTFDIFKEYPEHDLPAFEALPETARGDAEPAVRARAWESLADAIGDAAIRREMIAVMNDESRPLEERGGAAVGLYGAAEDAQVRPGIEKLYQIPEARAKALEAMWRSLWAGFAKFFPAHLEDRDPKVVREALRGAGYFELSGCLDKIARYFDAEPPFDRLRDDALFAYALAMPGETTRGRVRGMLRKLDSITPLSSDETALVEFALDERLRLHGLAPVFSEDDGEVEAEPEPPPKKTGRNDPCPCGSGRKYKKCCGANA